MTAGPVSAGNGTGSVTITGTAAQINAALAGLELRGNLNFNGADTLTVTTRDGTPTTPTRSPITVNAVNDAAGQHGAGTASVNEDTTLPITGVSVADVDSERAHHHADGRERNTQRDRRRRASAATAPPR